MPEDPVEKADALSSTVTNDNNKPPANEPELFPPEVLQRLPPEARKMVEMTSFMASISGPGHPPYMKKINEEHITKIIEFSDKDSQRDFEDAQSSKKYRLAYVLIFCSLFVFAVVYLGDKNPELLKEILKYAAVFAGGGGVGYGLKAWRDKEDE